MEPVGPQARLGLDRVEGEAGDGGEIAADELRHARRRPSRLEIEDDRQRGDDRRLALLGEAKLLLDPQPLGIGAQVGVEQFLLLRRLALDLLGHQEQVDEHRDLGAQHDRLDRLEHVIDRAHRIAAHQMLFLLVDRGEEDDRDALGLLAAADDLGGLVAVHAGHVDVEQDHRELALEEMPQRLVARRGDLDLGEVLEHGADGEEIVVVVVDDQHPRARRRRRIRLGDRGGVRVGRTHLPWHVHAVTPPPSARAAAGPCAGRPRLRVLPIHTRSRASSKLDVDRLGDIIGRAGVEAFLAVALHRLGGDRDQRQVGQRRLLADLLHRLVAVHLRHHDVDQGDVDCRASARG